MKFIKKILIIISCALIGQVSAQIKEYKEIRISRVLKQHNESYCNREFKFNSNDSTVWFRKNENKKFKKIEKKSSNIFFEIQTYIRLDSIIENFADYETKEPRKKTELYRIEIFIYSSKSGLKTIKTIEFPYNPGAQEDLLERLIYEYRQILKK